MAAQDYLAGLQYGAPGGGVGVNADKMAPEFANRLQALIQAAEKATGDKVSIFEGYRDPARSAQLRADYKGSPVKYGGKTYQPTPGMAGKYRAAAPGVSEHNRGMAADIRAGKSPDKYPSGPAYEYMTKHAADYGLHWFGSSDPAHFEIPPNEYKMAAAGKPLQPFKNNNPAGLVPPMNIPQVGTALDVIDRAVPRPMPSQIASAYAAQPTRQAPPLPQPRPSNIDAGGFNMGPPALPLNAPLPPGRGSSYGPETGRWAPSIANLGTPPLPRPVATPPTQAQMQAIRAVPAAAPVPMPGRPVALNTLPPIPMPGRPVALSAAPPAPVQGQPPQLPAQRPSAPVAPPQPAPVQLRLASGKTIAPGVYTQPDGHSVQVSDAGDGTAKITQIQGFGAVPGLINPMKELADKDANGHYRTIAGKMISDMLPGQLGGNASAFVPTIANNVKSAAVNAAGNLGGALGGFGGGILGGLGGLFGQHQSLPHPFNLLGGALQQQAPQPMNRPAVFSMPQQQAPQHQTYQQAQSDLRDSGMIDQFGMIRM